MGGYIRGGCSSAGMGELPMQHALGQLGQQFEHQYRVERWHIDLALWPLALEIERGFSLPHQDRNYAPDTFGGKKYSRLLSLFDRGWYVMAMRPPYLTGFDVAAQLVVDYLEQIRAGEAPRYVALTQYQHHGRWLRSEGTYEDGELKVVDKFELPPVSAPLGAGWRLCRLKMCGQAALIGEPHCADHYPIFAEEERAKLKRRR